MGHIERRYMTKNTNAVALSRRLQIGGWILEGQENRPEQHWKAGCCYRKMPVFLFKINGIEMWALLDTRSQVTTLEPTFHKILGSKLFDY